MGKHKGIPLKNEYLRILIIAIMMGVLGQTLIPWISTQLNLYYFNFRFLISNIDIYPFIVVLLIRFKNPEPKKVFWRILIYFIGLCLGYYGYTSMISFYQAFAYKNLVYLSNILLDLVDLLEYSFIGMLAGIWGYIIVKQKDNSYLYHLMLLPFILISIYDLYSNLICTPPQLFMIIVDILGLIGILICSLNKRVLNVDKK